MSLTSCVGYFSGTKKKKKYVIPPKTFNRATAYSNEDTSDSDLDYVEVDIDTDTDTDGDSFLEEEALDDGQRAYSSCNSAYEAAEAKQTPGRTNADVPRVESTPVSNGRVEVLRRSSQSDDGCNGQSDITKWASSGQHGKYSCGHENSHKEH